LGYLIYICLNYNVLILIERQNRYLSELYIKLFLKLLLFSELWMLFLYVRQIFFENRDCLPAVAGINKYSIANSNNLSYKKIKQPNGRLLR